MKRKVLQLTLAVGFAILLASFAHAQTSEVYRADVPFDFSVGKKEYTAGRYFIEVKGPQRNVFVLRDSTGRRSYAAQSNVGEKFADAAAELNFRRVGEQYFLEALRVHDRISTYPRATIQAALARNNNGSSVKILLTAGK